MKITTSIDGERVDDWSDARALPKLAPPEDDRPVAMQSLTWPRLIFWLCVGLLMWAGVIGAARWLA